MPYSDVFAVVRGLQETEMSLDYRVSLAQLLFMVSRSFLIAASALLFASSVLSASITLVNDTLLDGEVAEPEARSRSI
jgi:hypothetical protein